jgi:cupin fold WbuC family metalloprotein
MTNVFHNKSDWVFVGEDWLHRLSEVARKSPLHRARLCLHRNEDDCVQEMVIAVTKDCLFRPHRHRAKSESFHIIKGELCILIFSDAGTPVECQVLGPPGQGRAFYYRLCIPAWHSILPLTETVVFHESTSGPFVPSEAEFAQFAPTEGPALKEFLVYSARSLGHLLPAVEQAGLVTAR